MSDSLSMDRIVSVETIDDTIEDYLVIVDNKGC